MSNITEPVKPANMHPSVYEAVFNSEPTAIIYGTADGKIVEANEAACLLFGYPKAMLQQMHRKDLIDFDESLEAFRSKLRQRGNATAVLPMKRKDGSTFIAKIISTAVKQTDGTDLLCVRFANATELEIAEQEYVFKHEEMQDILNFTQDVIAIVNKNGMRKFMSESIFRKFGYSREELSGVSIFELVYSEDREATKSTFASVFEKGTIENFKNRIVRKDGELVYMSWSYNYDEATALVYVNGHDITPKVKLEQELKEAESRFSAYVSQAKVAIIIHDFDGHIIEVNNETCRSLGYTQDELLNSNVVNVPKDTELVEAKAFWNTLQLNEPVNFIWEHHRKDGTSFPVDVNVSRILLNGNQVIMGLAKDITEQQRIEELLKNSEEKYRLLVTNLKVGVVQHAKNGDIIFSNTAALDMLGVTEEQLLGKTAFDEERKVIYADGSIFPGHLHPVSVTIATEAPVTNVTMGVYRAVTKDWVWLLVNSEPVFDSTGQLDKAEVTFTDITSLVSLSEELEKSRQNLMALNDDLQKKQAELADKNMELERFAYVASHDLQEPLRMVSSFMKLLKKRYADDVDEEGKKYIEFAMDGALRMKKQIDDWLAYSLASDIGNKKVSVDMNLVVKQVLLRFDATDAEISIAGLPVIKAVESAMEQLMQNLVGNALKYRGTNKTVVSVTAAETGTDWIFSVKDNGIGIDQYDAEKIFIMFHRSANNNQFKGTGIGLATCKKIIDIHGGTIWVESAPGKGADFKFTIRSCKGICCTGWCFTGHGQIIFAFAVVPKINQKQSAYPGE